MAKKSAASVSPTSDIIVAQNLNKHYKGVDTFHALRDVDISIAAGELVSIVGQSGSGKSTLLYVLSTLDTDYLGDIWVDGKLLHSMGKNSLSTFRNEVIGFVFQFHYLLPEFSVVDNVMLPALRLGKYPEEVIRERALTQLNLLGMKEHANKSASQLSGGQQQRVAIARALINEPKVLFGDEPTGNLDSKNSNLVFEIFKELSAMGQTVVIVTHDMALADQTHRRISLKDGRVV
jgi:lipoprotein-releasing system ATP-binding protein